jgi:hypothetical protein
VSQAVVALEIKLPFKNHRYCNGGEPQIIRMFIDRGADLVTGYPYPIAVGLIQQTRLFLGIYKSYVEKYPDLQFQADTVHPWAGGGWGVKNLKQNQ